MVVRLPLLEDVLQVQLANGDKDLDEVRGDGKGVGSDSTDG